MGQDLDGFKRVCNSDRMEFIDKKLAHIQQMDFAIEALKEKSECFVFKTELDKMQYELNKYVQQIEFQDFVEDYKWLKSKQIKQEDFEELRMM